MPLTTALTERLGIAHPVLLAPMAYVSGGKLAAAVTTAGGLGFIGGGYGERDWFSRELVAAGDTPVGIGFITWKLAGDPDLLHLALDHGPRAIFLSFGDIAPYADAVKAAGIPLIAQVQTVAQARAALDAGADVLVAQGTEAGGHCGIRATLPLVPAVVDIAGDAPVVAAGGISDGRGLAAALMLGAAGVLCGTAFYVAEESLAYPAAKARAVAASGDETVRGEAFDRLRRFQWPDGYALRSLVNATTLRWQNDPHAFMSTLDVRRARFAEAGPEGDTNIAAVIVGEGVGQARAVEPAADILSRLVEGAVAQLRGATGLLDG